MIVIRALTNNGIPCTEQLSAEFDETGGSIGRAANNQFVLPDNDHLISRIQATIAFRNGGYVLISQGVNPVHLNNRPIDNGNSATLSDGDELLIGGYTLKVETGSADKSTAAAGQPVDDPLALFGNASVLKSDPFGGLLSPEPATPPPSSSPAYVQPSNLSGKVVQSIPSAPKGESRLIPEDFDPFADPFAQKPPPDSAALGGLPSDFDLREGAQQSIDTLFGLKPTSGHSPFAGTPLEESSHRKNELVGSNQLLDFAGSSSASAHGSIPDQVHEINAAFQSPRAIFEGEQKGEPRATQSNADGAFFLSWESENRCGETEVSRTIMQPAWASAPHTTDHPDMASGNASTVFAVPLIAPDAAEPKADAPIDIEMTAADAPAGQTGIANQVPTKDLNLRETQEVGESVVATSVGVEAARLATDQALLRSFIAGLGTPNLVIPQGMTPELMEQVGHLLRAATQGTLDLLLARAMTKSEMRASVTIIAGIDNNPLKFSPNVDIALANLLCPHPGRGFMPPVEAMQDAYDDLRSHQFGFMAGMRAALAGVLRRFNPESLEKRLKENRVLDNLVPMSRKAKLWELFAERYEQISVEAEEDFHTLFSKEFLSAYEEQITRLSNSDERKA